MRFGVDFSGLKELVERMGADGIDPGVVVVSSRWRPLRAEDTDFVIEDLEEVKTKGDWLADKNGLQIVVWIPAHGVYGGNDYYELAQNDPSEGNKFHVKWCGVLEQKKAGGTWHRYRGTTDFSGDFEITGTKGRDPVKVRLRVCKLCLHKVFPRLRRHQIEQLVETFNPQEFMPTCDEDFPHEPARYITGVDAYGPAWSAISKRRKQDCGYRCQECGVVCSLPIDQYLMHTHHKNSVKRDTSLTNLVVLCAECHAGKHGHMSIRKKAQARLQELRREQGLSDPVFPVRRKKVTLH